MSGKNYHISSITHPTFLDFWNQQIYPNRSVKVSLLFAKLIDKLSYDNESKTITNEEDKKKLLKSKKIWTENRLKALIDKLFNMKVKEFEEKVVYSLDYDGTGFITALKLEKVTQHIPTTLNLTESLLILANQNGRVIIPPMQLLTQEQKLIKSLKNCLEYFHLLYIDKEGEEARAQQHQKEALSSEVDDGKEEVKGDKTDDMKIIELPERKPNPFFDTMKATIDDELSKIPFGYSDLIGDDPIHPKLVQSMSTYGWHIVSGAARIGKTTRVLAALRERLYQRVISTKKPDQQQLLNDNSVADAMLASDAMLDPMSKPNLGQSGIKGANGRLDALYVDIRSLNSATEILSALAAQFGLHGETLPEIELNLTKLCRNLREESVIIFDNVSSAQASTVLIQLFDKYAKSLSLIIVTVGCMRANASHPEPSAKTDTRDNKYPPTPFSAPSASFNAVQAKTDFEQDPESDPVMGLRIAMVRDPLLGQVIGTFGTGQRLDLGPGYPSLCLLKQLPQLESLKLAKAMIEENNMIAVNMIERELSQINDVKAVDASSAAGDSILVNTTELSRRIMSSDMLDADAADLINRAADRDPMILTLLSRLSKTVVYDIASEFESSSKESSAAADSGASGSKSEEKHMRSSSLSRRPSQQTMRRSFSGLTSKIPLENIFGHSGVLGGDEDCLVIVACLLPLVSLQGIYFNIDLAWSLCKHAFFDTSRETNSVLENIVTNENGDHDSQEKIIRAWEKLLQFGWLEFHWRNKGLVTVSVAAYRAIKFYETATNVALKRFFGAEKSSTSSSDRDVSLSDSHMFEDLRKHQQWDKYYAYWSRYCVRMCKQLKQRGFTIVGRKRFHDSCDEEYMYLNVPSVPSLVSQPLEIPYLLSSEDITYEIDMVMPHLYRLASIWTKVNDDSKDKGEISLVNPYPPFNSALSLSRTSSIFSMAPHDKDKHGDRDDASVSDSRSLHSASMDSRDTDSVVSESTNKETQEKKSSHRMSIGMTRERDKMKKRKMKEFVTSPANLVASIDDEEFKDTEVIEMKDITSFMTTEAKADMGSGKKRSSRDTLSKIQAKILEEIANLYPALLPSEAATIGINLGADINVILAMRFPDFRAVEIMENIVQLHQTAYTNASSTILALPFSRAQVSLGELMLLHGIEEVEVALSEAKHHADMAMNTNIMENDGSFEKSPQCTQAQILVYQALAAERSSVLLESQQLLEEVIYKIRLLISQAEVSFEQNRHLYRDESDIFASNKSNERNFIFSSRFPVDIVWRLDEIRQPKLTEIQFLSQLLPYSLCLLGDVFCRMHLEYPQELINDENSVLTTDGNDSYSVSDVESGLSTPSTATSMAGSSLPSPISSPLPPGRRTITSRSLPPPPSFSPQTRLNTLQSQMVPAGGGTIVDSLRSFSSDSDLTQYTSNSSTMIMSSLASSQLSQLQSDHLPVGSRAERARQLFEEARIFYLTRYGQNSQKAAETCCDLGDIMRLHERFRESKSLYEAGLIALKPRHDILHPRVAHLIFGLADVIRKDSNVFADHDPHGIRSISPASRERLAGRLLEEALVIFRTVYSDDNPFVVATANALASIMSTQMRYDRAISLYQQSLTSARSALKRAQGAQQKDKETVKIPPILLTIAGLHDKMKRYDLAEPFYQEALSTYRDLYGYKHVCVADALCLLARSIDLRGREPVPDDIEIEDDKVEHGEMLQYLSKPSDGYDEAAHHLRDALNIYSALRMQDTPMAVKAWKQLALLHEGNGSYEKAKDCYENVLSIFMRIRIGVSEELADTYIEFAKAMTLNEDYDETLTLLSQAQNLYYQLFGDVHIKIAHTDFLQGGAYLDVKAHEDAQPYFEKAMALYAELLGPESDMVARCNNSIGYICQELDEYEEALGYYRKALQIFLKNHGKIHIDVSNTMNNLATLFDDLDEYEEAIRYYDQTLIILRTLVSTPGEHDDAIEAAGKKGMKVHRQLILTLENMATLLDDCGLTEKAEEAREEAKSVEERYDSGMPLYTDKMYRGDDREDDDQKDDDSNAYKRDHPNLKPFTEEDLQAVSRRRNSCIIS